MEQINMVSDMDPKPPRGDTGRRMLFLREFMSAMNINVEKVAEIVKCHYVTVAKWLTPSYDDAPLSSVMNLIDAYGYKLDFVLTRDYDAGTQYEVLWERRNRARFKADRLAFLTKMMLRYDITSAELGKKMGLHRTSIEYMFKTNDLMISRIYRIADVCDMNVFITIEPKEEPYKEKTNYCTTKMTIVSKKEHFAPIEKAKTKANPKTTK